MRRSTRQQRREQARPRPDWFAEIGRPPASIPADADRPPPLQFDGEHRPIDTLLAWRNHRASLYRAWEFALGPRPERPNDRAVTVLETEPIDNGALIRERVRYAVEPGFATEAYRIGPRDAPPGSLPGCVVFHSTVDHTIRQPAGLEGPPELHLGLHLARRGFVTLCPENFLWRFGAGRGRFDAALAWHRSRHPRSSGMLVMLHEAFIAVDILERDPRVDRNRLGAIGHSLGAKEVLYLTAADPRIATAVFSEGGLALPDSNWDAAWYLGDQVRRPGFPPGRPPAFPRPWWRLGRRRPLVAHHRGLPSCLGPGTRSGPQGRP